MVKQVFEPFRDVVVAVLHELAAAPWPAAAPSNVDECILMLRLIKDHTADHALVLRLVGVLTGLLTGPPPAAATTHDSLTGLGAIYTLHKIVLAQTQLASNHCDLAGPEWPARQAVFGLVRAYLAGEQMMLRVLCDSDISAPLFDTCFELLAEPHCRVFALDVITFGLTRQHDDVAAPWQGDTGWWSPQPQEALIARYTAFFSTVVGGHFPQPLRLVNMLLEGICEVVTVDRKKNQNTFRGAMCFLHIITFWNTWDNSRRDAADITMTELSVALLRTLSALTKDNDESKHHLSDNIGFDQLRQLLVKDGPPPREIFSALLDMMLDGKPPGAGSARIQNRDCILLFFNFLLTREPEFQAEQMVCDPGLQFGTPAAVATR